MSSSRVSKTCRHHVAALVAVIVAFVSLPEARAETAAPATNVTATPKPPACSDSPSDTLPPGNLKLTVVVDPTTLWQPRGGEVKFTI
jgi:hypothetical protein